MCPPHLYVLAACRHGFDRGGTMPPESNQAYMASTTTNPSAQLTPVTAQTVSQLSPDAVYAALGTSPDGLTSDDASARVRTLGSNELIPRSRWQRWLGPP